MRVETLPSLFLVELFNGRLCYLLHVSNIPLQAEALFLMSEVNTVEGKREILPVFA